MTLSVSLAFMLPAASPNNALIFASGNIKILDMISTGIVMNIIGLAIIYLASNFWLVPIFNISVIKESLNIAKNLTNSTI